MDKANFIIPGLYEHTQLLLYLLELKQRFPDLFYDEANISSIYGSFQYNVMEGGRTFSAYKHSCREEVRDIVKRFNSDWNIPVRLVLTNPIITKEHFYNRFANMVLEECCNPMNEIVINNVELEEYIREKYPDFTFISSTTKCLSTPEAFMAELDKNRYKMICLDYNLNKQDDFLNNLPLEKRQYCEFLVNAICPPGCKNRKSHYDSNGESSLCFGKPHGDFGTCPIQYDTTHIHTMLQKNTISPEEVYSKYIPMGYNLFKIEGRSLGAVEVAINLVRYLVKPENQFFVLHKLLEWTYSSFNLFSIKGLK